MTEYRGSEIDTFAACRKRYEYEYVDQIEANKPQKALFLGTLMHKFLDEFYTTRSVIKAHEAGEVLINSTDLSQMDQVEVTEMLGLYDSLLCGYNDYWHEADKTRKTLATELKFRVLLDAGEWYTGTIDHLFTDTVTELTWLEDHKTVKSIAQYINAIEYSRQTARYLRAMQMLARGHGEVMVDKRWVPVRDVFTQFPKINGIIYNLIGKTIPHPPKVLKNGGLSVDKSQYTTLLLYEEALREIGAMDDTTVEQKYVEMLNFLEAQETPQGNRYFRRVPILISATQATFAFNEMLDIIDEIQKTDNFYRNSGRHCGWCQYKAICSAEAAGDNIEMILDTMYRPKTENPYAEDEEEDAPIES